MDRAKGLLFRLSERLEQSVPLRHLFFLAAAALSVWLVGYRFGTFDQAFHIPFLYKMVDPALYPGDPFLDLRFYHYSYFWFVFEPFLRAGILEPVMFVVHLLATYLTFWMLWELSITLFGNPLAALMSTVAFVFPHIAAPGFPLIEDSLLNRTFVLPFLILAMVMFLRKHYFVAFLVLGLMLNLHALSVSFIMFMLIFDGLLRYRTIGWKNLLLGLLVFGVSASPALFWKSAQTGFDLSLRPELLALAGRGALSSIYYLISTQPILVFTTLCGIGTFGLLWTGLRRHISEMDRVISHFAIAIGLVLVVQIVSTYWLPVTILLQLQLSRIAFYFLIFGYLYFAAHLAAEIQSGRLMGLAAYLQVGTYLVVPAPFVTWIVWALKDWLAKYRWRRIAITAIMGGAMLGVVILGVFSDLWQPGFYIYGPQTAWVAAQEWARDNTPVDSLFITPPQLQSQYIPDWRVFSKRGSVVTLDELEDIPFYPDAMTEWVFRFNKLAPGAIAEFNYNYYTNEQITANAFYNLSEDEMVQIAREYQASYLVLEKPHSFDFPIIYQNGGFVIYDLRSMIE